MWVYVSLLSTCYYSFCVFDCGNCLENQLAKQINVFPLISINYGLTLWVIKNMMSQVIKKLELRSESI